MDGCHRILLIHGRQVSQPGSRFGFRQYAGAQCTKTVTWEKSKPALFGGGTSWRRIYFKPQVPAPGSSAAAAARIARWSSLVARQPHKLEVAGSNPARASSP